MNLLAQAPIWAIALLAITLIAAAVQDMLRLHISNVLCAAVAVLAVIGAIAAGPQLALWQNITCFAVMLFFGTMAFSRGLLGGGDVKLIAALLLWVDLRIALGLIITIVVMGGLLALVSMMIALLRGKAFSAARKRRLPYGLPIAVGALACIAMYRGWMTAV